MSSMKGLVCVQDFEDEALRILDKNGRDYYRSGTDDEITLKMNKESYNRWLIRPRMLRDVSKRNLRKMVLGKPVEFPIGCSPLGFQGFARAEGEVESAKAAQAMGTIYCHSTYATRSIEDVAKACPTGRKWFQLFPNVQDDITRDFIKRAEDSGFEAVVLTVDAQKFGNKLRIKRNGVFFPPHLSLGNYDKYFDVKKNETGSGSSSYNDVKDIAGHAARTLKHDLSWDFVPFLRKIAKLPIILKGILTPEDAIIAMSYKVDGIWVSNHGGRQVDTVPQPIDVLEDIVRVVQGKCEIYIDSGVRKGTDAFKALALGANMVFVGRPQVWGNAVAGAEGITEVLKILKEELDLAMALSGVADINKITRDYVSRSELSAKL